MQFGFDLLHRHAIEGNLYGRPIGRGAESRRPGNLGNGQRVNELRERVWVESYGSLCATVCKREARVLEKLPPCQSGHGRKINRAPGLPERATAKGVCPGYFWVVLPPDVFST